MELKIKCTFYFSKKYPFLTQTKKLNFYWKTIPNNWLYFEWKQSCKYLDAKLNTQYCDKFDLHAKTWHVVFKKHQLYLMSSHEDIYPQALNNIFKLCWHWNITHYKDMHSWNTLHTAHYIWHLHFNYRKWDCPIWEKNIHLKISIHFKIIQIILFHVSSKSYFQWMKTNTSTFGFSLKIFYLLKCAFGINLHYEKWPWQWNQNSIIRL